MVQPVASVRLAHMFASDCRHLKPVTDSALAGLGHLQLLTIGVNGTCYDAISEMGLPAYHKTIGLGSWQQLSCDEEMKVLHRYCSPLGETRRTNPDSIRNIFQTLDQVIAPAEGSGTYRMSMKFVRGRHFRSDEILIYPCNGERGPTPAERGPQANDLNMMRLSVVMALMSIEETWWTRMLRFQGILAGR